VKETDRFREQNVARGHDEERA